MILNFSEFITTDLMYKQNPDGSYLIENGELVQENMNDIIDTFMAPIGKNLH